MSPSEPPSTLIGKFFYYAAMLFTLVWFIFVLATGMYAVAATWAEWWPYTELNFSAEELTNARPAIYALIGGMIGGALYSFRGFSRGTSPERGTKWKQWDPTWTIFNISRPIFGAILAAIVFAVVTAGVATVGTTATDTASNVSYFATGFLAGFGASDVFEWLTAATKRRFPSGDGKADKTAGTDAGDTTKKTPEPIN